MLVFANYRRCVEEIYWQVFIVRGFEGGVICYWLLVIRYWLSLVGVGGGTGEGTE